MLFVIPNRTVILFATLFVFTLGFSAKAQFEKDQARSRILQIDQTALHADLKFQPEKGEISGSVRLDFASASLQLDSLWLDGIRMRVDLLHLDGEDVRFKVFEKGIAIFPDTTLEKGSVHYLEFAYQAYPKRGMYFLGWNDPDETQRKQIWTQGQGIDNRHWLPHVDAQNDKLTFSLDLTFNSGFKVISNGKLTEKEQLDGDTKWHYKMDEPMSSYLLMIAIGEYESLKETSANGVELTNYYYPDWEDRNKWTYYKSTDIFNWMVTEIGVEYPWQNYKQVPVKDFQHGAMENTTSTIFGDFYCVDEISFNDDNYVGVNAHELAHQWFGNSVTALSSHDHWLHEGFATYYSWLAEKEIFGEDRYNALLLAAEDHIVQDENSNPFPLHHSKAGSIKFYEKGAWVLHMLRAQIGEEAFDNATKAYLEKHKYNTVTTQNFKAACQTSSEEDMNQFFNQWLERPGLPMINVTAEYDSKESRFTMRLEQTQKVNSRLPVYSVKIPFVIYTNFDTYNYESTLGNVAKNVGLTLNPKEEINFIEVDPNADILAKWVYNLPKEWVVNQLKSGKSKTFSARVLKDLDRETCTEKQFEDIESAGWPAYLQSTWTTFLIECPDFSEKYVANQMKETSREAKLAYLDIAKIPESHEKMVKSWLEEPSYSLIEKALLKLYISFPENGDTYLKMTKDVVGTRGSNVRVMWLYLQAVHTKEPAFLDALIEMTSPDYDFLTRMASLDVIDALNPAIMTEPLLENCFQGVFQGNRRWRGSAIRYLRKSFEDSSKQKAIFAYIESHKADWQDWQKKRVENVFSIEIAE